MGCCWALSRFAIARLALSLSTFFLLLAVFAAESLSATAADAPQPTPPVQRVPEAWLSAFQIKRGFRLEVVASEALVSAPVAMAFDENGRLFVAEMRDLPNKQTQAPHLGRIRLLEDTDGDGIFDASTVYADNLAW